MIIVYNIPQHRAIDFIGGRNCFYYGDSILQYDEFMRNLYLKPARSLYRVSVSPAARNIYISGKFISCKSKKMLLIDTTVLFNPSPERCEIDLLIISKNPKLYLTRLVASFNIKKIVFDSSVPLWKLSYWKKDCDSLHIPYHDVSEKGAFVMNFN